MRKSILSVFLNVYHIRTWCPQGQKVVLNHPELKFQVVVSCHMGGENQTWLLPSRLSSPN